MKTIISTDKAPKAIATYSQAVKFNNTLFISGQIAIDPAIGKLIDGDIVEQTVQVMKNIGEILEAAGYTYRDVVKTTCLLSTMENYAAMNATYGKYFPENPPARAAFAALGLPLGALVEIETIAMK
jgi:2-iminobutanoate/2-iminopropanoate deaminase